MIIASEDMKSHGQELNEKKKKEIFVRLDKFWSNYYYYNQFK